MKRILSFLFLLGMGWVTLYAQNAALKFNQAGEFKIVQFTDVHFKYGNPASDIALERIDEVLEAERPDLVVLTGDVIYAAPADKGMRTVLERVSAHQVPFVVTFGNHDDEQGMTRTQLYDLIRSVPGCLMPDRAGQASPDYTLTVQSSDGKGGHAAVLYFFDSHSYSKLEDVKGYDWLTFDQVENYRRQSAAFTTAARVLRLRRPTGDSRCQPCLFSTFRCPNSTGLLPMKGPFWWVHAWRKLVHPL